MTTTEQRDPILRRLADGENFGPVLGGYPIQSHGARSDRRGLDRTADTHDAIVQHLVRTEVGAEAERAHRDALLEVLTVCSRAVYGATRWEDPLQVPMWVHPVREAIAAQLLGGQGR
jgi:hypothetical protein